MNDKEEIQLHLELLQLPGLGLKALKQLLLIFGNPSNIINANKNDLIATGIVNKTALKALLTYKPSKEENKELAFIDKHNINVIAPYLNNYPKRLLPIEDAPSLLFTLGNFNIDHPKHVAIIGTRNNTEYGKLMCTEIIQQLQHHNIQVISGLADGIDGIAHKNCIEAHIPTVGVLGHGLDTIFPAHHKKLAHQMLQNGGLLTEYPSNTIPHKTNFPMRNRIVAALSDFILVVETKEKGGAMITANIGFQYNKEIGAIPGSCHVQVAKGCHKLIKSNIAHLIESGEDILNIMNWQLPHKKKNIQMELFENLKPEQLKIIEILQLEHHLHFDELLHRSQMSYSTLSNILLQLELQNCIASLPGKRYQAIITT